MSFAKLSHTIIADWDHHKAMSKDIGTMSREGLILFLKSRAGDFMIAPKLDKLAAQDIVHAAARLHSILIDEEREAFILQKIRGS